MANTIQIKRTTGSTKPASVQQGELVYAYDTPGTDTGGYGKKLFIGDPNSPTNNPKIVGGEYYTNLIEAASIEITGPGGVATYATGADGLASSILLTQSDINLQFSLTDTGVSAATYGSSTAIPSFTVDAKGRISAASETTIATTLNFLADSNAGTFDAAIALLSESLSVVGTTNEVVTEISADNTIRVGLAENVTITGNLTVNGTTTTVNSTTVTIDDPIFTVGGDGDQASEDNLDRGIEFKWHDGAAKTGFFGFDDSQEAFTFIPNATNTGNLISGTTGKAIFGSLELGTDLAVQYGGTGVSTFTSNGIVYGNAASALQVTPAGTWDGTNLVGQILSVNSSGTPTWTNSIDGGTY